MDSFNMENDLGLSLPPLDLDITDEIPRAASPDSTLPGDKGVWVQFNNEASHEPISETHEKVPINAEKQNAETRVKVPVNSSNVSLTSNTQIKEPVDTRLQDQTEVKIPAVKEATGIQMPSITTRSPKENPAVHSIDISGATTTDTSVDSLPSYQHNHPSSLPSYPEPPNFQETVDNPDVGFAVLNHINDNHPTARQVLGNTNDDTIPFFDDDYGRCGAPKWAIVLAVVLTLCIIISVIVVLAFFLK